MNALNTQEDEFDFTGKTIAAKLRKMDYNQFLHADKLINEVLYNGLQNQLSSNTSITNDFHRPSPNQMFCSGPQSPFTSSSNSGSTSRDVQPTSPSDYDFGCVFANAFEN